jgi:hypothetical protein
MKISLRAGIILAFAVFIALALGATRIAHVVSYKALLAEELQDSRSDLEAVTANLEKLIGEGREAEGLAFFDQASTVEDVGRWDCYYMLCDSTGTILAPSSLAGRPLEYSVYQERPDGITLGTYAAHKVAVIRCPVAGTSYTVFGLYDKDYLLGDNSHTEGSYRTIVLFIVVLLLLIAWIWVIPAIESIIQSRRSAEKSLSIARNIQQKAVTQVFPSDDRIDAYAILEPMFEVGGDIYGCRIIGNKLCFVIGDVSGKGMGASFMMFMVSSLVFPAFKKGYSPSEIALYLNDLICDNPDYDMFCTLLLGTIDLDTREMEYCNAGHTLSLLDDGLLPQVSNFVLGGFTGFPFQSQKITLSHGSRLVFYTDGVTEARNEARAFFGEEALLEWAKKDYGSARETCKSLLREVRTFRGKAPQNDDIAIMTIKIL